MPVAIVTDSTSDIEPERAQRLGVTVVPLFVTFGSQSYRDYVDLSRAEFYAKLRQGKELPSTSQPTPEMFQTAFASSAATDVLCITISSHLSGTLNAAHTGAARVTGKRIEVFDSLNASGGLALLVLRAAEMAKEGAPMEELLPELERLRRSQCLFACIPDLSHLQRTGRIGRAQAALGTLMRIVPVLALEEGQVVAREQVRTFARAQERMLDLALEELDAARARFIIMHTDAPELAAANKERLMKRLNGVEPQLLEIWEAGPAIATHGGPGAVGICIA